MSPLRKAVEDYLILRRALGFKLRDMATALRHFVSFMEREGACTITTNLALRWAMQPQQVQPAHWAARLSFVRSFARHWSAIDPQTEIPPQGLLPYRYHRCTPHLYTDDQIRRLIKAAWNLPPNDRSAAVDLFHSLRLVSRDGTTNQRSHRPPTRRCGFEPRPSHHSSYQVQEVPFGPLASLHHPSTETLRLQTRCLLS